MKINPLTIPHGSLVTPRAPLSMGRINAHPGQTFWIVSAVWCRPAHNYVRIARSGKNMAHAVALSFSDLETHFEAVSDFS